MKNKISYATRYNLFEYYVFSFELTNTFAFFQFYINKTLIEKLNVNVIVYLNDIFIYFENFNTHDNDVI